MSYSDLVGSQNELLGNLASENVNVEMGNIQKLADFDKKKKDISDAITGLQNKEQGETGKIDLVEGIPVTVEDVGGVLGTKATYNLYKNARAMQKAGGLAVEGLQSADTLGGQLRNASKFAQAGAKQLLKPPVTKAATSAVKEGAQAGRAAAQEGAQAGRAAVQEGAQAGRAAVQEGAQAARTAVQEGVQAARGAVQGAVQEGVQAARTAVQGAVQEGAQAARTAVQEGVQAGRAAAKEGAQAVLSGEKTIAGAASDIIGKAGAGLSIASGLELGSKDLTGLAEGKGWGAFGDNTSERVGNILSLAGDVTSVVPGGEIIGGLLDLAGGAFNYFGEKSENDKINAQIDQENKTKNHLTPTPPQSNIIHPSLSTLGIVSNVSHPVAQMIAGSGSF
jgi:hypothetical protein